jgi:plasmid maintenance system antidote protein VapI
MNSSRITPDFSRVVSVTSDSSRETKAFGSTPETWLRMQVAYDLAAARKKESKIKVHRQHIEEIHVY